MEHGAELFRDVMSQFAAGVTLVTGMDESGVPVGFTANAVASVSLNPRLILVCVDRGSASLPVLLETGKFAVSVLRSGDGEIAHSFAVGIRDDRFREHEFVPTQAGPPTLRTALAWMSCRVWRNVEAGDHTVLIGEVAECGLGSAGGPLVYFGREFRTIEGL